MKKVPLWTLLKNFQKGNKQNIPSLKVFEIHQYNNSPYLKVLGRDRGLGEGEPSFKKVPLPPKEKKEKHHGQIPSKPYQ